MPESTDIKQTNSANTTPQKTRGRMPDLEKLQAKKQALLEKQKEIDEKIKKGNKLLLKREQKARTAERTAIRKAETRKKIECGGLVKIAGLFDTDRGAVLGVLLWAAKKFRDDPSSLESFKKRGDEKLAEFKNAKKDTHEIYQR